MKSTVKKISFSIVLALIMACTLLMGVLCLHTNKSFSSAAGKETAVKIETDKTSVAKGGKFTFTITVTPQATDMTWNSANVVLVPTLQDGTPISQADAGLQAALKDFSVDGTAEPSSGVVPNMGTLPDEFAAGYRKASYYNAVKGSTSNRMGFVFGIASLSNGNLVSTETPLVMSVEVTISDEFVLPESGSTTITFTVRTDNKYSVIDYNNGGVRVNSENTEFTVASPVELTIRNANSEATLDGVKIGHDADHKIPDGETSYTSDYSKVDWDSLTALEFDTENVTEGIAGVAEYELTEFDIDHFHLNPIPNKGDAEADPPIASSEGATVKAIWGTKDTAPNFGTGSTAIDLTKTTANELFGTLNKKETLADDADPVDWTIYLQVTPECGAADDGSNVKVYQINVTIAYVRLGGLEGGKYSSNIEVTKDGVVYNEVKHDDAKDEYYLVDSDTTDTVDLTLDYTKANFKPDQDRYWVYIPNDFKTVDEGTGETVDADLGSIVLKASILSGYGASKGIAVADITAYADGTDASAKIKVPSDPIESGSDITISNIPKTSATYVVTLTVTANDGETTEEYTLHLQVVSVDNSLKDMYVLGKDTGTRELNYSDGLKYTNENFEDEDHPEIPKDGAYFFTIYGETLTKTGRVIFEPNDMSVVIEYKANEEYPDAEPKDYLGIEKSATLGYYHFDSDAATITYDLRVTAEAGNVATFTVTLSIANVIKMKADATFYFLYELVEEDDEDIYYYRMSYPELGDEVDGKPAGWTHGKEDMLPTNRPEKFVLGQIGTRVTINDLLAQIETDSKLLRIYDKTNTLLFKDGEAQNDAVLEEPDPDDEDAEDIIVNYLGTGWRIEYWLSEDDTEAADVVWISVLGDVDDNDDVDASDSAALALYIMGNKTSAVSTLLTLEGRLAAYIWNDGSIAPGDLARLNYVLSAGALTYTEVDGVLVRDLDLLLAEHFYTPAD